MIKDHLGFEDHVLIFKVTEGDLSLNFVHKIVSQPLEPRTAEQI